MSSLVNLTPSGNVSTTESLAERFRKAYRSVDSDKLQDIAALYATDLYFEDPAHGVQGRQAFLDYFEKTLEGLDECGFHFHDLHVKDQVVFATWTMRIRHPRLRGGDPIYVDGASHLRTRKGSIYYHRDYFDMGSMLYEHLPLLGRLIRKLKKRLASKTPHR